jgi:hypothetical protein
MTKCFFGPRIFNSPLQFLNLVAAVEVQEVQLGSMPNKSHCNKTNDCP